MRRLTDRRLLRPCAAALLMLRVGVGPAAEIPILPPVDVVGVTSVPGTDLPRDQIPSNVQTLNASAIRDSHSLSVPELMSNRLQSVNVNEIQGNPFQLDVNYRGFTASPALGTPQGLSVFVDGVRVNEPFGDVVNWDLIPLGAVDSIVLMPGSNPVFGLNTLGGALVLHTKRGDTHPGTEAALSGGSFGRRKVDVAHGSRLGAGHAFAAVSYFEENGWRDYSPSRVSSAFGKIGGRRSLYEWDFALTYAKTRLVGNGLLPEHMLAVRREQIYTRPDQTDNVLAMGVLNAAYSITPAQRLSAVLFQRSTRTTTLNGDVNDEFAAPGDPTGVENRTGTRQRAQGLTLQWSHSGERNQITVGAAHERSRSHFIQTETEGTLDATRAVVPTEETEASAQLRGRTRTSSVYLSDTYALAPNLQLSVAARYNSTRVQTVDELNPSTGPNLNADHAYRKLNPAAGLTWQATPALTFYGGYSQGSRAPSPIELGCADPAQPCTLPNALQSDPFLKQVVARTVEVGVRGKALSDLRWSASLFRTQNRDDILFVGTSASASRGFFQNFGRTRRQGTELALGGRSATIEWQASYSYVRATFESDACIVSESNSSAGLAPQCAPEQIAVQPGDALPGIPRHALKLNLTARPAAGWTIGGNASAFSSQFVRGNENNAHHPDGAQFNGAGKVSGFAVVDVFASYALAKSWMLFAKVSNVFDRQYATAGQLGRSAFDAEGRFVNDPNAWRNDQFAGPGAPRAGWIGIRYRARAPQT